MAFLELLNQFVVGLGKVLVFLVLLFEGFVLAGH